MPGDRALEPPYPLTLITTASDKRITSTFWGVKESDATPLLEMNPEDAVLRAVDDGRVPRRRRRACADAELRIGCLEVERRVVVVASAEPCVALAGIEDDHAHAGRILHRDLSVLSWSLNVGNNAERARASTNAYRSVGAGQKNRRLRGADRGRRLAWDERPFRVEDVLRHELDLTVCAVTSHAHDTGGTVHESGDLLRRNIVGGDCVDLREFAFGHRRAFLLGAVQRACEDKQVAISSAIGRTRAPFESQARAS